MNSLVGAQRMFFQFQLTVRIAILAMRNHCSSFPCRRCILPRLEFPTTRILRDSDLRMKDRMMLVYTELGEALNQNLPKVTQESIAQQYGLQWPNSVSCILHFHLERGRKQILFLVPFFGDSRVRSISLQPVLQLTQRFSRLGRLCGRMDAFTS